jgi:catechol 2,3-dioxygenase-like lactoylglutathione lyase family enzyme
VLDHVGVNVSDFAAARAFYVAALEPLGIKPVMEMEGIACGFGDERMPYFWIAARPNPTPSAHIAFSASDRATVDAFHTAAIAAGARDNGEPGPRPIYHEHYYGAFVLDPDGNNIEAVCHRPEG